MIRALGSFFALLLAAQSSAQTTLVSDFVSPCPHVFSYDPLATGHNRWYGTVNLTSDIPLYALWLNIVLENKANILGNWLGEVTTDDNIDFKIENTNVMITPSKPLSVPFFVQYNDSLAPPKLKAIRFNGKEICEVEPQGVGNELPLRVAVDYEEDRPEATTSTTASPTVTTALTSQYWTQPTESALSTQQTQYWQLTTPATYNNPASGQTTDTNRIAAPFWPNATPNQNSKATRPNGFQIEVTQVGNTKFWSKIPENTTGATVMAARGTKNISNGWSGNEQKVPDSGLQNQPYADINNQAGSTQNLDQPRDTSLYVRYRERESMSGSRYEPKNNLDVVRPQNSYQPWGEPARNGMAIQSGVDPSRYPKNDGRIKNVDGSSLSFNRFQTTSNVPVSTPKTIEEDNSRQGEGYVGGLPVFYIPNFGRQNIGEPTCGKVMLNKGINQNLQSTATLEGQWPWLTAIYQQQNSVDLHYKYVCGGTLVSRRNIITAAHCVARQNSARPVNMDTLLVFMGKHNLRTTVEGEKEFVHKILIYPEYDPTTYRTDLAILTLREPVTFTNKIQPVCLWPEQDTGLQHVVGETGSTVGWGYEVTRALREDQTLLQMEVIAQQTCLNIYADFFSRFNSVKMFCAAYRNTGGICNGDSGGGMVFQKGDSWYLRGVAYLSVARQGTVHCNTNDHVIFTDVAKFLPWIQDNIEDI